MSVREAFDKSAVGYDADRKILIPCYDDYYATTLDVIPFAEERELRVVDLGAGTGALAKLIAQKYPRAQITLLDIAPTMLEVAEKSFAKEDLPRISFQVIDYAKENFNGTYDLIVSSLSIHHLTDGDKQLLFGKIYKALEPGGFFINADQALGENEVAENMYSKSWVRQVRERGVAEQTLQAALERMKEDRMSPLSSQLLWLQQAGFTDVTSWYQFYSFTVYSGTKPLSAGGEK